MNILRAYIAGIAFPATIIPIAQCLAFSAGNEELAALPQAHLIPILWGIWNILYLTICSHILPQNVTLRYLITGGSLGIILSLYGVFWIDLPAMLGVPQEMLYYPLLIVPIGYAIVWRLVVYPLNRLVGLNNQPT